MDIARLGIQIDTRGVRSASKEMDSFSGAAGRALKSAAGLAGAYLSLSQVSKAAQSYANMSNALLGMGQSGAQAAATMGEISGIASRTRAPLESTAELYRRVTIAGRDLGASGKDVSRFTENVGIALASAGVGAEEASGALLQLSQAMASGQVQSEEFNSILEGAFPIAQAAANGIEGAAGSVGKLRTMVKEGEVTSKEFFDAILSQSQALEEAFGRTGVTMGQGLTVLNNGFTEFVGKIDQASGVSNAIGEAMIALGNAMMWAGDHADQISAALGQLVAIGGAAAALYAGRLALSIGATYVAATVSAVRQTIALEMALGATSTKAAVASAATKALAGSMRLLRGALVSTGIGALVVGMGEAAYWFGRLKTATGGWGNALSLLGDVASGVWSGIQTSAEAIPVGLQAVWASVASGFLNMIADLQFDWFRFVNSVSRGLAMVGADAASSAVAQYAESIGASMDKTTGKAMEFAAQADAAKVKAQQLATQGFAEAKEAAGKLAEAVAQNSDESANGAAASDQLAAALSGVGDSGSKAAKGLSEAERAAKAMREEIAQLEDAADPVLKYANALEHLDQLKAHGLSQGAYNQAVSDLNDEMANSLPLVGDVTTAFSDFLYSGANDFKSFGETVRNSFRRLLADMIATAARNQIMFSMGMTQSSTTKVSGGGGLLSGISNLFSGFKGFFADGGTLGAGEWGIAGEAGPEKVVGPAKIISNKDSFGPSAQGNGSIDVKITFDEGLKAELVNQSVSQSANISFHMIQANNSQTKAALGGNVQTLSQRGTS